MKIIYRIDDTDKRILEELQKNARMKISDLAKVVGVAHATAFQRLRALESRGVIKGYRPVLDYALLGMPLMAIVGVKTTTEIGGERSYELITSVENVLALYSTTGDIDGVVLIAGKDMADIEKTVLKIRDLPQIKETNTQIVLRAIETSRLPIK